ncbi:serine/arginine repetitive matrix protein 1-like isoform X2 [Pollicipes pollicipes]|uniref:serine/arginine repetitive matrix protein 1-like isoform X2 n=1 Tax=Pollicipes pollicipes TaxID=41117 RepID=UPI0018856B68|nr:serine/arginine repetitive matrix protein 1-like isoform X2 [Pollicipes pollicipes]
MRSGTARCRAASKGTVAPRSPASSPTWVGGRWAGPRAERERSFKHERGGEVRRDEPALAGRRERPDQGGPRGPGAGRAEQASPRPSPKPEMNSLRRRPRPPQEEEPIQPIIQERRTLSQPSLFFPRDEPPAPEEPFSLYANIPYQLPARRPASPDAQRAPATALKAKRAMSQPSLLEPRPDSPPLRSSAERSDTVYAYSPHREAHRDDQRPSMQRPQTRTVWRPTITVKRKGILKRQKSAEKRAEPAGQEAAAPPARPQGVLHGIAHNIRSVFKHRKNGDDRVPEGYVAIPGGAVVSERFTNITNTHEEKDDVLEEEEVHHLGNYTNEEVSRAVRDGDDARALVRQRAGSGHSGQLVDPRSGQRRVVHQSGKTWRTVDTEDIHEKTHQDEHGELITETARTHQQEQFNNVQVPDDGSGLRDGEVQEAVRSSNHNRRHVKDVDMLEYYSIPKGGRLADGIKLGEGLRYVQENVEEDREGDDNIESLSERMRQLRQLGYKPEGQALAKTPIEYQEEEKTRRKETHKWLESHFGSESGGSQSSEEGEPRGGGRDEVDRRREFSRYEFQKSSGTSRKGDMPSGATSWERSKEVKETPEKTYIKETRHGPHGDFERVQVLPPGSPMGRRMSKTSTETRTEVEEDPIFSSKFSSGKPRGAGVRFQPSSPERRRAETLGLSPPTQSPPPPPPPRHRRKGRDTLSPQRAPPPDNHYASAPIREQYERDVTPGRAAEYRHEVRESRGSHSSPRRHRRDHDDGRRGEERRGEPQRMVKEYHFRSSESPRGSGHTPSRDGTPGRYEHREQRHGSRHDSYSTDERDGHDSARRRHYDDYYARRDRTASTDELSSRRRPAATGSDSERRVRYQTDASRHHRSTDQLDRYASEERRYPPTRAPFDGGRAQTLPRKPRDFPPSPVARPPDATRFGGSMINVSLKNQMRGGPGAPQKPARSPVQRSNSLYSKEAPEGRRSNQAYSVGLKSPDIISKIQRTASMRRGEQAEPGRGRPEDERYRASAEHEVLSSLTSSSSRSYPRSPTARSRPLPASTPHQGDGKKDTFMRGLMKNAPELYSVLHDNERKDSKTPSPRPGRSLTPPPPLERVRSPPSPVPLRPAGHSTLAPGYRRTERLRGEEDALRDSRSSHSYTPEDAYRSGERTNVVKVQR